MTIARLLLLASGSLFAGCRSGQPSESARPTPAVASCAPGGNAWAGALPAPVELTRWTALSGEPVRAGVRFVAQESGVLRLALGVRPASPGLRRVVIDELRARLGLGPADPEMYDSIAMVPVGTSEGELIAVWSADRTRSIFLISVKHGQSAWLLEVSGDAKVVEASRADFLAYAKSLRWP